MNAGRCAFRAARSRRERAIDARSARQAKGRGVRSLRVSRMRLRRAAREGTRRLSPLPAVVSLAVAEAAVNILAIDPGSSDTAFVVYSVTGPQTLLGPGKLEHHDKRPNEYILDRLRNNDSFLTIGVDVVVIEMMSPRGMPTSRQEMETLVWVGRFVEAGCRWPDGSRRRVERIEREAVKRHLIGSQRPKGGPGADARIRSVLIDLFGGIGGKDAAIGRKAKPGPLFGVTADRWAALAVAVTFGDLHA